MGMSDFAEKVREMLAYFPHAPLRYDTRSWKCFDNEGIVLFEFKPWDKSGCRFEDLAMFSLFSSAPTLLRESCERIKILETVAKEARCEIENHGEDYCPCMCGLCESIRALDAADAEEK